MVAAKVARPGGSYSNVRDKSQPVMGWLFLIQPLESEGNKTDEQNEQDKENQST